MKQIQHKYAMTYAEFINYRNTSKKQQKHKYSETGNEAKWYGTNSITDADDIAMCRKEWKEGKKLLEELRSKHPEMFTPQIEGLSMQFVHDVAGCQVDIGRYMDGEPECMYEYMFSESDKHGKIVDVYYQFNNSCGITSKDMIAYGIAVLALVDNLESRGYSCNIYAVGLTAQGSDNVQNITITIKEAGETLNVEAIMYAFHTSFFRRHWFAFHERESYSTSSYGQPQNPSEYANEDVMMNYNDNPTKSFYIPSVNMLGTGKNTLQYFELIKGKVDAQMESIDNGCLVLPSDKFVWK